MTDQPGNTRFLSAVGAWSRGIGGLRDAVRQGVVAAQVREWEPPPGGRVLDVGCGQGTQALALARRGFDVVGLDISTDLLAAFERDLSSEADEVRSRVRLVEGPGEHAVDLVGTGFDLVLCHGLLMYFDDATALVRGIAEAAAPAGRVSVVVRNGLAPAMRPGLLSDFEGALASFDDLRYVNRLGLAARAHTPDLVDDLMAPHGLRLRAWYGVRVFNDHLDGPAPDDAVLGPMLAAEIEAGRRDPYRQLAALLHLVYGRDKPSG